MRADELLLSCRRIRIGVRGGVGRADNDGVTEARCCRAACVVDGVDGLALDGALTLISSSFMDEEFADLGVHDGLYGCSSTSTSVALESTPFS